MLRFVEFSNCSKSISSIPSLSSSCIIRFLALLLLLVVVRVVVLIGCGGESPWVVDSELPGYTGELLCSTTMLAIVLSWFLVSTRRGLAEGI